MNIYETIERPTLLLDEETARHNIQNMAAKARAAKARFRPHFKTHQSREIGRWFREEGVQSITVSSAGMAEWFAEDGWNDILIAFPVNIREAPRIEALAGKIHLGLVLESPEAARLLAVKTSAAADIWLKIDTGAGRTGISWDDTRAALQAATAARAVAHLRLRGLLTHAGHTYQASGRSDVERISVESISRLKFTRQMLAGAGFRNLELSIGDTPGSWILDDFQGADEIRPGNFVFFDAKHALSGTCAWENVAVALACPVVALHPERGEAVLYGGGIHLSMDTVSWHDQRVYALAALPDPEGRRWGPPLPDTAVVRLSQEHGILKAPGQVLDQLHPGSLLCLLPAHSCMTVQCMGSYRTLSGRTLKIMPRPGE